MIQQIKEVLKNSIMADVDYCKKKQEMIERMKISEELKKKLQTKENKERARLAKEIEKDEQYMRQLRCMDDIHTEKHGLSLDKFQQVCSRYITFNQKQDTHVWIL